VVIGLNMQRFDSSESLKLQQRIPIAHAVATDIFSAKTFAVPSAGLPELADKSNNTNPTVS